MPMIDLTVFPEWKELAAHQSIVADLHLRELFASNPGRAETMTVSAPPTAGSSATICCLFGDYGVMSQ